MTSVGTSSGSTLDQCSCICAGALRSSTPLRQTCLIPLQQGLHWHRCWCCCDVGGFADSTNVTLLLCQCSRGDGTTQILMHLLACRLLCACTRKLPIMFTQVACAPSKLNAMHRHQHVETATPCIVARYCSVTVTVGCSTPSPHHVHNVLLSTS